MSKKTNKAFAKTPPRERIPGDEFLTTYRVAQLLQVDASTVAKWMDRGMLIGYRTLGGHRRVRASEVRRALKAAKAFVPPELEE